MHSALNGLVYEVRLAFPVGGGVEVPDDQQFGLFQDNEEGPVWRASFADFEQATREAQKLADAEGREFFVYSFNNYSEVARSVPVRRRRSG